VAAGLFKTGRQGAFAGRDRLSEFLGNVRSFLLRAFNYLHSTKRPIKCFYYPGILCYNGIVPLLYLRLK
jgi:hypothetical protein